MSLRDQFTQEELKILQARTELAARKVRDGQDDDMSGALTLAIWGESYALNVEALTAVYENITVISVPCVPSFIGGVANVRGHIIPVLELGVLLNIPPKNDSKMAGLVVASWESMIIAFRVESIGDVITFSASEVEPLPANLDARQADYLQGILPGGIGLLDIKAILSNPELIINETPG
jgi:purine-binding chemotaxis protein CheW